MNEGCLCVREREREVRKVASWGGNGDDDDSDGLCGVCLKYVKYMNMIIIIIMYHQRKEEGDCVCWLIIWLSAKRIGGGPFLPNFLGLYIYIN